MSDIFFELQEQLAPILRAGDLAECDRIATSKLRGLPSSPFHIVLDLRIATAPEFVAASFDDFFRFEDARFGIEAAYIEMNGFDINPGWWWCSAFAYARYGGHEDYGWLSDWDSDDSDVITIEGLQALQWAYIEQAFRLERFHDACAVTCLLVVIRFQDLIQRAAQHMRELRFPLLATAHGYDFIYEIRPDDQTRVTRS
ncbi:MAG: hypothetical protein WD066_09090 [Planctomycetaceae bacterium]